MRRSTKKKVIPLALALALALIGAALAVPTINVTVQELGEGAQTISSSVSQADIEWDLDTTNPDFVTGGSITINDGANAGVVYIKLYDAGGNLVTYTSVSINGGGTYSFSFNNPVALSDFSEVYVVYQGS